MRFAPAVPTTIDHKACWNLIAFDDQVIGYMALNKDGIYEVSVDGDHWDLLTYPDFESAYEEFLCCVRDYISDEMSWYITVHRSLRSFMEESHDAVPQM